MRKNFPNIFDYIDYFKKLILLEREEERRLHLGEIKRFSPQKRENAGRAILNLKGKDAGRGLGKTYLIKFKKIEDKLPKNEIQVGDLVIVTQSKKPSGQELQGTVISKNYNSITVAYPREPQSYHYTTGLRLDLFTNDVVFQRQKIALSKLKGNWELKRNLLGNPLLHEKNQIKQIQVENEKLNQTQIDAVNKILETKDFFLLHGPPGTGKTTTLVESILQCVKNGDRVLVCCDSNQGVDNILEKITKYSDNVVRIGNPSRIDTNLTNYSLDYLVEFETFFKDAKLLHKEIERSKELQKQYQKPTKDLRRGLSDSQIKKYGKYRKQSRGVPAPLMRKMASWIVVQERIRELSEKSRRLENYAIEEVITSKQIICTTNTTAGAEILENYINITQNKFNVVFIDEATQAVEPSCLIPAIFAPKLILAGDHKQLPPTVLSNEARDLNYSLFERLIELYPKEKSIMLDTQYRMHQDIVEFSNKTFYENKLKSNKINSNWKLKDINIKDEFKENNLVFIDTKKIKNNLESSRENSTSYLNQIECEIVEKIVDTYLNNGAKNQDIGVITPYDLQVQELKSKLNNEINVKSIDGFQGGEKEIIIISFVRSNLKNEIGFLKDKRRLNVALTRAKKKLILIGNSQTLNSDFEYKNLIKSCEKYEYIV